MEEASLPVDIRTQAPHHSPCLRKMPRGGISAIEPLPTRFPLRYGRGVFWLTRPPYLRWAAAAAIVLGAFVWDLHGEATTAYPFAARSIPSGAALSDADVTWKDLPSGVLALPDLSDPVTSRSLAAGEPIVPSALGGPSPVPDGWWSVPVPLPPTASPGARARLVAATPPVETDGVVVSAPGGDLLSYAETGMVAVPPEAATAVAVAAGEGTLIVLLEP